MNKDKLLEAKKVVMYEIGQALEKTTKREINFSMQMAIAEILGDLTATLDDRLDDIIQSEPEETCITLPCKIGETVWIISDGEAIECTLQDELIYKAKNYNLQIGRSVDGCVNGKQTVFTSQEEAEQALNITKAGE